MRVIFLLFIYFILSGCFGGNKIKASERPLFGLGLEEVFQDERVRFIARAAARNDVGEVDRLISSGVPFDSSGVAGFTPLYWALKKGGKDGFKELLKHGANPNVLWKDGGSVTHYSATLGDSDFLLLCLNFGGEVDLKDGPEGRTPLFYAVEYKNFRNIKILLENGADIDAVDSSMSTPMLFSAMLNQYDVVYFLLRSGASPSVKNRWGKGLDFYLDLSLKTMDRSNPLWDSREKVAGFLSELND